MLYGTVLDTHDRELAERVAGMVRGVKQILKTLKTKPESREEARINDTLLLNDLQDVSVTGIGNQAYLSGQVSTQAEKNRTVRIVESRSNLNIVNLVRIVPRPIFKYEFLASHVAGWLMAGCPMKGYAAIPRRF